MAIDTATFETTLDSKIDAATTSDDAKSFLLLAKAVEAVNNAVSSSSLARSNNLSDLLNTTTALTNLGFTATIAELNYTDGVTSNIQTQLDAKAATASPTFTGTPAAPTAATGTNTTQIATTAFVQGEVTALVDSAPSTLNTLNELAAALGDDANFSTTVTNSIAAKLPLAGGTMTGNISHASDLALDVGGELHLDADSGIIRIRDNGGDVGMLRHESNDFTVRSMVGDGNLVFKGNDGGSVITALTLDMSEAGAATFNSTVTATGATINGTLDIEEVFEKVQVSTTTSGTITFPVDEYGVRLQSVNQTANRTINFSNVNANLAIGQSVTVALLASQGSTAYYLNAYQVDGSSVTPKWSGGSAPTAGNASGIDSYSFTIIKTADATFTVLASITQYA